MVKYFYPIIITLVLFLVVQFTSVNSPLKMFLLYWAMKAGVDFECREMRIYLNFALYVEKFTDPVFLSSTTVIPNNRLSFNIMAFTDFRVHQEESKSIYKQWFWRATKKAYLLHVSSWFVLFNMKDYWTHNRNVFFVYVIIHRGRTSHPLTIPFSKIIHSKFLKHRQL